MSDEEKWVKAYEKLKKEGMLAPAVDYEELFAKSEFQGKKTVFIFHGNRNFPYREDHCMRPSCVSG